MIEKRPSKKGTRYRVKWRVGEGGRRAKQDSETFDGYTEASRFARLVEVNGHHYPSADDCRRYDFEYLIEGNARFDAAREPAAAAEPEPVSTAPATEGAKPTFLQFALEYIEGLDHVLGYTKRRYRSRLGHLVGHFDQLPIDEIDFDDVQRWQRAMVKKGLSRKTIQNIRGEVLVPVFKAACAPRGRRPALIDSNPMFGLRLPPGRSARRDVITTREDIRLYMNCAYEIDPDAGDLLMVAMATAMRWGDLAGMRKRDINLQAAEIRPGQVLARGSEDSDSWELRKYTKTIAGDERVIAIPPGIVELLARRIAGRRLDDLVFTAPMGGTLDHSHFRERRYLPILELAQKRGLAQHITPHCLRHSLLTILAEEGTDPKVMQHMAGHENVSTTYNTYVRPTRRQREAAAVTVASRLPGGLAA